MQQHPPTTSHQQTDAQPPSGNSYLRKPPPVPVFLLSTSVQTTFTKSDQTCFQGNGGRYEL